jgi:hypothetical protein
MPSGRPMIVIMHSQANDATRPLSHQPTKMNHTARTSRPGPVFCSTTIGGIGGA